MSEHPEEIPLALWARKEGSLIEFFQAEVWSRHLLDSEIRVMRTDAEWHAEFRSWRDGERS